MIAFVFRLSGPAFFALSLVVATSSGAAVRCVVNQPTSCSNVNELLLSNGFDKEVTQFVGNKKVSFFQFNKPLGWQALYGLSGPPDERRSLSGGLYLFAACPAHNCGGQAVAIVLDGQGVIKGVGFSSFHCGRQCENYRSLDIYAKKDVASATVAAVLSKWGIESVTTVSPQANEHIAERTFIHLVP